MSLTRWRNPSGGSPARRPATRASRGQHEYDFPSSVSGISNTSSWESPSIDATTDPPFAHETVASDRHPPPPRRLHQSPYGFRGVCASAITDDDGAFVLGAAHLVPGSVTSAVPWHRAVLFSNHGACEPRHRRRRSSDTDELASEGCVVRRWEKVAGERSPGTGRTPLVSCAPRGESSLVHIHVLLAVADR